MARRKTSNEDAQTPVLEGLRRRDQAAQRCPSSSQEERHDK